MEEEGKGYRWKRKRTKWKGKGTRWKRKGTGWRGKEDRGKENQESEGQVQVIKSFCARHFEEGEKENDEEISEDEE